MTNVFLIYFILIFGLTAQDQDFDIDGRTYRYSKPSFTDIFTQFPAAYADFYGHITSSRYANESLMMVGSTALLIAYDQEIYNSWSAFGRNIGIGNHDGTSTFFEIDGYPIFRGPTDVGSALYYLGDGWFHISIALSFYAAGSINNDNRALQTAMQIGHGLITTGLFTQTLKHITGRETPNHATSPAGKWRFFPNQIKYHKNVPKYDAFPSGHVATAMMTLTVIAENYAEYTAIYPIGLGLIGLLSFQMVNNGVHWASDYPLAIFSGYLFGKIAVDNNRTLLSDDSHDYGVDLHLSPGLIQHGFSFNLTLLF